MDILGLFDICIVEEVQNFFGSIVAWVLGMFHDLTGLDWFNV
jgi:hypothetical protein